MATGLLRLWVWIPPGGWMFVCCECFVLSGRCLCDKLITRPEESYRLWCVVCDLEKTNLNEEGQDPLGGYRTKKKKILGYTKSAWGNKWQTISLAKWATEWQHILSLSIQHPWQSWVMHTQFWMETKNKWILNLVANGEHTEIGWDNVNPGQGSAGVLWIR